MAAILSRLQCIKSEYGVIIGDLVCHAIYFMLNHFVCQSGSSRIARNNSLPPTFFQLRCLKIASEINIGSFNIASDTLALAVSNKTMIAN